MGFYSPYAQPNFFRVCICGCSHVKADKDNARDSIGVAMEQMDGSTGFDPEIAFFLGDFAAGQNPKDVSADAAEGVEVSAQLNGGPIDRERVYTCHGNHDGGDGDMDWYNKYVDDFGNDTANSGVDNSKRPFTMEGVENTYYKIVTGNITWLIIHDINDGPQPCGRSAGAGGFPSGSVLRETIDWWKAEVLAGFNAGQNVITMAHHLLKNTTIATGDNEGVDGGYHGSSGQPIGSGRLHNIINDKVLNDFDADQSDFIDYMAANSGQNIAWLGSHTHHTVGEAFSGRDWNNTTNGCLFVSVGSLSRFHLAGKDPQSVAFIAEPGSATVKIYKFLHDSSFRSPGFDSNFVLTLNLNFPFKR